MTAESRGFATPHNLGSLIFIVVVIKYIIRASSSSVNQDDFLKLCSERHITPPTKLIELSEVCILSLLMAFKAHECYCNWFITQINKYSPNMPCLPRGKGIKSNWVTAFSRSFCPPNRELTVNSHFSGKDLICKSAYALFCKQKMARAFIWN